MKRFAAQMELHTKTSIFQGPVVKNFVSLTVSLSPQFVDYISPSKAIFLLIKCENPLLLFVDKI